MRIGPEFAIITTAIQAEMERKERCTLMNILRLFGIGSDKILAMGCCVKGKVTKSSRCWWLTVNTKPVRRFSGDGALHPSIITFEYQAGTISCTGKLYIPIRHRVPQVGESIDVYYGPEKPQKYACHFFVPGIIA